MNAIIAVLGVLASAAVIGCIVLAVCLCHAFDELQELRQELRFFKLSTIFWG